MPRLQSGNSALRCLAHLRRQNRIAHIQIDSFGITVKYDYRFQRAQRNHYLHLFVGRKITYCTYLYVISSVGHVGEDRLRIVFTGLPGG